MNYIYLLGAMALIAYVLQALLGIKQIKHFNHVYQDLRKKGKVAIGRRSGKVKAGTIVMFAVKKDGTILEAQRMQGVTVVARFKPMPDFIGEDIHYLDHYNPVVRKENKLIIQAIENAREIFCRVEAGNYHEEPNTKMTDLVKMQYQITKNQVLHKLKGSV